MKLRVAHYGVLALVLVVLASACAPVMRCPGPETRLIERHFGNFDVRACTMKRGVPDAGPR